MEVTVMNVNSALAVRSAHAMLAGKGVPAGANPFELAGSAPPNFLGALASPDLEAVERRSWLFDTDSKELVYVPRFRRDLATKNPHQVLRFRTVTDGKITKLVPTTTYSWE
ncbi:MAG TPA: hypothetical protein VG873_03650 [Burkholderiales bacterium]|nr:hypothetical protein [Burkholderiales bacterium]